MKEFRRNLPLLMLLTSVTILLNGTKVFLNLWLSIDHWALNSVVIIADGGWIVCVLFWTTNHVLIFAKATTHEYNKVRGALQKNGSASKAGTKTGNGN